MTKQVLLLLILIFTSGCVSLKSSEPPPAIYTIRSSIAPSGVSTPATVEGHRVIFIPKPDLPAGFTGDKIALYWNNGRRLDYFASARWADSLDLLLQNSAIEIARQKFPHVIFSKPDLGISANYILDFKILNFQPVYPGDPEGIPTLEVEAAFTLISLPEERIVKHFIVRKSIAATANNLTSIADGLKFLFQQLMNDAFEQINRIDYYKHDNSD